MYTGQPKIVADWRDNSKSNRNSITALKASVGLPGESEGDYIVAAEQANRLASRRTDRAAPDHIGAACINQTA